MLPGHEFQDKRQQIMVALYRNSSSRFSYLFLNKNIKVEQVIKN